MCQSLSSDVQARAAQSRWYLYFSRDRRYGPEGYVRAVIEEEPGEVLNGDDGPERHRRRVFLSAVDVRDNTPPPIASESGIYDGLDQTIEIGMDDESFQTLIIDGVVIPIGQSERPDLPLLVE
jgi:hypothetical protein